MMAAQPQPPQQPILPHQLNSAMDQLYLRITRYVDAHFDAVMTQMRVDKQESIVRDETIRQESLARDNDLRAGVQALTDAVLRLTQGQQETNQRLEALTQEMRQGFAAQAERHNELMVRVERLERGNNPPPADS